MNEDKVSVLREQLSALADGELGGNGIAELLAAPAMGDDLQSTWHVYHVIGDALRGGDQAARPVASAFLSQLQVRLQAEAPLAQATPVVQAAPVTTDTAVAPANDARYRWRVVAGCASFAVVAGMAWSLFGGAGTGPAGEAPQLAVAPALEQSVAAPAEAVASQTVEQSVTLANGEAQVMLRDARLDDLLTAHKQVGGGTALQMPAGFLRGATFAVPER